jgi:hypothetical protein
MTSDTYNHVPAASDGGNASIAAPLGRARSRSGGFWGVSGGLGCRIGVRNPCDVGQFSNDFRQPPIRGPYERAFAFLYNGPPPCAACPVAYQSGACSLPDSARDQGTTRSGLSQPPTAGRRMTARGCEPLVHGEERNDSMFSSSQQACPHRTSTKGRWNTHAAKGSQPLALPVRQTAAAGCSISSAKYCIVLRRGC